jgi:hypothetical protein
MEADGFLLLPVFSKAFSNPLADIVLRLRHFLSSFGKNYKFA